MASAEEDDIDLETLQAQIDRSVAFTNELVSSWIKPSLQSSSSRRTTEQEFEQLIRRPPRCFSLKSLWNRVSRLKQM